MTRRSKINISILEIKDAGTAATKNVRTDYSSLKQDELPPLSHTLVKTTKRSGDGRDYLTPAELPTNAVSFCYSNAAGTDVSGLNGRAGTVLDFNSLGINYRTQIFSDYKSTDLYFRTQDGDKLTESGVGTWNPWHRIYHTGFKPNAYDVNAVEFAKIIPFGGSGGYWTTEEFISFLKSKGAFKPGRHYWTAMGSWDYSGNKTISNSSTGCGNIPLAGALVEAIGTDGQMIIRVTTASTSSGVDVPEGTPLGINCTFIYVNNGAGYDPGWRVEYNNKYRQPQGRFWGKSDYPDGCLIKTSINAAVPTGPSFIIDIVGKQYLDGAGATPIHVLVEGYLYNNTIINHSGLITGSPFNGNITLLKLSDGMLGIWLPPQGYWKNYGVIVTDTVNNGFKNNLVTSIVNSTKPSSDKAIEVVLNRTYGSYNKPTPADVGLSNVPNKVHTTNGTPDTVPIRDGNGDIHSRLFRPSYPNEAAEAPIKGAIAYRNDNGTDNYIRFCSNPAMLRRWLSLDVNNEVKFEQTINTSTRSFRSVGARYGSFWHNDGTDTFYLMFTNRDNPYGDWSNLRPMYFNMANGSVQFSHGLYSAAGLHMPPNTSITFNASANWAGGIGWGVQEESSSGDLIFHRYNNNVWQNAPFRVKNDGGVLVEGNGNFNDVYIRSDIKLKGNFRKLTDPTKRLMNLQTYFYDKYRAVDDKTVIGKEFGIIAQSLVNNFEAGLGRSEDPNGNEILTISNSAINGLIVNYLQKLNNCLKLELNEIRDAVGLKVKDSFTWE